MTLFELHIYICHDVNMSYNIDYMLLLHYIYNNGINVTFQKSNTYVDFMLTNDHQTIKHFTKYTVTVIMTLS